ncbi:GNAT family N-acetyltransferase [Nocardioides coralli]|uniref:GNAT family N-acetyltransferase n=1 Tax=Nocardioides coralli TaxID=2872154 RepID=UPI001CA41146|nr:GNAT family N-acetyltransferase [Nocardioides coralli]QZY28188.1 GNAT family N-acetyltransferase [Nocardioides coralli]
MTFELVEIGEDDWREFRELRLEALADSPAAFGSRHEDWVDASEERWRDRIRTVPFNVIARQATTPVGMASGSFAGAEVQLISMYVAPSARGTGLARLLLDRVVAWASTQGRGTFLMVRTGNEAAIRAYQRAGFVDEGVPVDWPADEPPENRMVRPAG